MEVPIGNGNVYKNTQSFRLELDDVDTVKLVDEEYVINFEALHATEEELSSADKRFSKPATLIVENEKMFISFTVSDSSSITKLNIEEQEVETLSVDEGNDTRVIKFPVDDLSKTITGQVFVHVPDVITEQPYFILKFDTNSITVLKITEPGTQDPDENETEPVTPEPGNDSDEEQGTKPEPQNPDKGDTQGLVDGEYNIRFIVRDDKDTKESVMDGYAEKPAKLIVENGKIKVQMTYKNADWIHAFQLYQNGEFKEADVLSEDTENKKRVYEFPVKDLTEKLRVKTHVIVPFIQGYDNWYEVLIVFDQDDIAKLLKGENDKQPENIEVIEFEELKAGEEKLLGNITKETKIETKFNGIPLEITVPPGSNSLKVDKIEQKSDSLTVDLTVGGLDGRKVTLTLPQPHGLQPNEVGAYHYDGKIWEYRPVDKVENGKVTFKTNLSTVKLAKKVDAPTKIDSSVTNNKVTLRWTYIKGAEYNLQRTDKYNKSVTIKDISDNSYTDTVDYNNEYTYSVKAIVNNHESASVETEVKIGSNNSRSNNSGSNNNSTQQNKQNGEYKIDFNIYKNGTTDRSVMAQYVKTPAKLTKTSDGKYYVTLTFTNSDWIKKFEIRNNGGTASVVSENKSADTRDVRFEVYDLSKNVEAYTEVLIPEINYDGKYIVQIKFDESSMKSTGSSTPKTKGNNENEIDASRGGKVTLNGVEINIPSNALSKDFTVKVEKVSNTNQLPKNESGVLVSDVFEITKDVSGNFSKNVTITLPFNKSMAESSKYNIGIYWLNDSTKQWVALKNIKVDYNNGKISGDINHFTKFAVFAFSKGTPKVTLTDIKGHWAEQNIVKLVELGAVSGYPNGQFKPNNNITRAEFVTMLVKAFHLEGSKNRTFHDTKNHWAKDAISIAAEKGIIAGYDANTFGPNDFITREQMAAMIIQAANVKASTNNVTFKDRNEISAWAKQAIAIAVQNDIIGGYQDNTFKPKGKATRAEAVTVIVRALN